ncbi:hypothetical protein [Flavivirga spongiicola]|uniref:Uncharacterized protein n=1 Tax=Flavivirga spongiicola TaxID=421621 RepID=A0ABU7XP48_9FLAO|nr:hypothetical protein [Flavivirga sp. MEBiC05379]MDO5981857.1 hypothetical protein [Flavivirga sp. MEBiC05379]
MKIKKHQLLFEKSLIVFMLFLFLLFSCNTPKYTYMFETGKHLDFSDGKWLLNRSKSNSKVFDAELYYQSKEQFGEILGKSLLEIHDVRLTRIIAPEIAFNLEKKELIQLHKDAGCDFLINIRGKITTENVGGFSLPSSSADYYATNEAYVSIKIYDLKTGHEVSSSKVYGKVIDRGYDSNKHRVIPTISTSSHNTMLLAAKKLISKYKKYQIKKGS